MSDEHHAAHVAKGETDDPGALSIVGIGLVSVVLTAVTIIGLEVLHRRTAAGEFERKVVAEQPEELRRLRAEQTEQLATYRWVDQNEGTVAIPIERAMELIVEEAGGSGEVSAAGR